MERRSTLREAVLQLLDRAGYPIREGVTAHDSASPTGAPQDAVKPDLAESAETQMLRNLRDYVQGAIQAKAPEDSIIAYLQGVGFKPETAQAFVRMASDDLDAKRKIRFPWLRDTNAGGNDPPVE